MKQAIIELTEPIISLRDCLYEYGKYFSKFYENGNPYPEFSSNADMECVEEFLEDFKDEQFIKYTLKL
jgi:hypothetical protein